MAIRLKDEKKKQILDSIKRYALEELDLDVGDLKAGLFFDFVLQEIGPTIYNQAIADAQAFFQEKIADLEGSCHEHEFGYWQR